MRRRIGVAVAIVEFVATAVQAEPLRPGMAMPEIRLMDQHDVEATIGTNVRYVLVTRDMDSGNLVKEALAENGGVMLDTARAVYVSDISRMPCVITKLFPQARWHRYETAGIANERAGPMIPFGEHAQPVYHFDRADVVLSLDADFWPRGRPTSGIRATTRSAGKSRGRRQT